MKQIIKAIRKEIRQYKRLFLKKNSKTWVYMNMARGHIKAIQRAERR